MRHLHVITDLQFGSTGKGLFAGYLANRVKPDTLVTAWGPNAGHTFIGRDGFKHVNIMIANGIVASSVKQVLLGPGSIVNPDILLDEMKRYPLLNNGRVELWIHEHAAVVTEMHRSTERAYGFGIGSTMKGVGEAVVHKIRRDVSGPLNVARESLKGTPLEAHVVSVEAYNGLIDASEVAILEGAQGFSLSINQGMYPYTTSRDCTTHQLLSDCGIPRSVWREGPRGEERQMHMRVYGVARTYPIRVANRYAKCVRCDGSGQLPEARRCWTCEGTGQERIGTSGPCYPDQTECKWEDIGREPELTTVTKLPRRIFTFSPQQIRQAIRMNGVGSVFLNFCNYVKDPLELANMMREIEATGADVRWSGWGPNEADVKEITNHA